MMTKVFSMLATHDNRSFCLLFFVSSNSECEDDDDASVDGADAATDGADAAVIECVSLPGHSLQEVVM